MLKLLKSNKITIPAAILLIVAGILVYFSDRLTPFIVVNYLYLKTKTPEIYLVPIAREVQNSVENLTAHYDLSTRNIKFKAPWILREKAELNYATLFAFVNKKGLEIAQKDDDERLLLGLLKDDPNETQKMELLYGKENLESEYAFVNLILHTSPDQTGLFKTTAFCFVIRVLLTLKVNDFEKWILNHLQSHWQILIIGT